MRTLPAASEWLGRGVDHTLLESIHEHALTFGLSRLFCLTTEGSPMDMSRVSLGLTGAIDHGALRELAPLVERAGFRTLWLNDTTRGDSLAGLQIVHEVSLSLLLGTGVVELDRATIAR